MTPLSSLRQNTVRYYYMTSTARTLTSSLQWNLHNKAYHHFRYSGHHRIQQPFSTTVYRKPTYTDQYLHWDSNHHITAKQSVYNTWAHGAKVVSSSQGKLDKELQHIKTALQACQFPKWALNQWHHTFLNNNQSNNNTNKDNNHNNNTTKRNITLVVPYIKGTSEKFKRLCKSKGIQVHFKGTNTLGTQLVNPKDKDPRHTKVASSTITNVHTSTALRLTQGNQTGHGGKELKNISRPLLQSSTTAHPQAIHWILTTSTLYIRKYIVIPGPSRKLCSYVSMTQI